MERSEPQGRSLPPGSESQRCAAVDRVVYPIGSTPLTTDRGVIDRKLKNSLRGEPTYALVSRGDLN